MKYDTKAAHKLSSYHKEAILASEKCGCFYCLNIYPPTEIKEWIDGSQTALCPRCGIDSVIGDHSIEITSEFLSIMQDFWFEE